MKDANSFLQGYNAGLTKGKEDALLEYQRNNPVKDLPSKETLFKIFKLLFESKKQLEKTNTVFANMYDYYADYITTHWND